MRNRHLTTCFFLCGILGSLIALKDHGISPTIEDERVEALIYAVSEMAFYAIFCFALLLMGIKHRKETNLANEISNKVIHLKISFNGIHASSDSKDVFIGSGFSKEGILIAHHEKLKKCINQALKSFINDSKNHGKKLPIRVSIDSELNISDDEKTKVKTQVNELISNLVLN